MRELKIDEIKIIQLNILDCIHRFCIDHGLKYCLYYGSLIGAVRHNGFIPWDDDIDIAMPREDYEFLVSNFNNVANDSIKLLSTKFESDYCYTFAKVIDESTIWIEETTQDISMGVYVDVFPLDIVPSEKSLQRRMLLKTQRLIDVFNLKITPINKRRAWYKNVVLLFSQLVFRPFSLKKISRKIQDINKSYRYLNEYRYVANMTIMIYGNREIMDRSLFENFELSSFEGHNYYIPHNYDVVLKQLYGDYMTLPPKEKRITHHHYKAYLKEIDNESTNS